VEVFQTPNPNANRFFMCRILQTLSLVLGLCVGFTLPVSARQDTDDHGLMPVAVETYGAVALGDGLPSVPELVQAHGLSTEGMVELEAWRDSWNLLESQGILVRVTQVYPGVAARLYPLLSLPGVADLLKQNEESLRSAKKVGVILANEQVEHALQEAMRLHEEAYEALQDDDGERALRLAFQSADALRVVSPERVATELLEKAKAQLRRIQDIQTYSLEEMTRIRRLTGGAEEALRDGDYPRAIRRAYYACQLLGADPG
jgi:hypothetical protein